VEILSKSIKKVHQNYEEETEFRKNKKRFQPVKYNFLSFLESEDGSVKHDERNSLKIAKKMP